MKCIFCTLFLQEKYVKMFFVFIESILRCGTIDDDTDILVYTSSQFMKQIKDSHLYNVKIKFIINDDFMTLKHACNSRLDLFNYKFVDNYTKILYLDTDIIVTGDLNKIFDLCKDDILYCRAEGNWDIWHGVTLFQKEERGADGNFDGKSPFSSGVLLFNNCDKIRNLFHSINKGIKNDTQHLQCEDQSYIIYNAFITNLYNSDIMKPFVKNYPMSGYDNQDIDSIVNKNRIINHFSGGIGDPCNRKTNVMKKLLNEINEKYINDCLKKTKKYITDFLLPIIDKYGEHEGNIFMLHREKKLFNNDLTKAKNICLITSNINIKNVIEIGFNSGFSALLMLMSNPNLHITCFDLGTTIHGHQYALPCYETIKKTFGDRIDVIWGDSNETLCNYEIDSCDLVHIDGSNQANIVKNDIINSYKLSKKGTIIIMNDYNFKHLNSVWDEMYLKLDLKKLDIGINSTHLHDVKYIKNKNINLI